MEGGGGHPCGFEHMEFDDWRKSLRFINKKVKQFQITIESQKDLTSK
jgi:hypothetical protein